MRLSVQHAHVTVTVSAAHKQTSSSRAEEVAALSSIYSRALPPTQVWTVSPDEPRAFAGK